MPRTAPVRFAVLDVDRIHPDPYNRPDKSGEADMEGLVRSIKALGILHPLIVVEMKNRPGHYQIRAGERRWRGAQQAGVEAVLAIIRNPVIAIGRIDALLVAIVENFQRVPQGPVELALMFGELIKEGMTQADICRLTGLSSPTISYHCELLKADDQTLNRVRRGQLPVGAVHEAVKAVAAAERSGGSVTELRKPRQRRGTVNGSKLRTHFDATHPLASVAYRLCKDAGHRRVVRIGHVACGECWERAIRADAMSGGGRPLQAVATAASG